MISYSVARFLSLWDTATLGQNDSRSDSSGDIRRMSHRKRNNGPNGLQWPAHPIQPIFPFPVRHLMSPHGTKNSYSMSRLGIGVV